MARSTTTTRRDTRFNRFQRFKPKPVAERPATVRQSPRRPQQVSTRAVRSEPPSPGGSAMTVARAQAVLRAELPGAIYEPPVRSTVGVQPTRANEQATGRNSAPVAQRPETLDTTPLGECRTPPTDKRKKGSGTRREFAARFCK